MSEFADQEDLNPVVMKSVRAITRPGGEGFASLFVPHMFTEPQYNGEEDKTGYTVDGDRIQKWLNKMGYCFYHLKYGISMSENMGSCTFQLNWDTQEAWFKNIQGLCMQLVQHTQPVAVIANGAFAYWEYQGDDPNSNVWVSRLYRRLYFATIVGPSDKVPRI